ncbi:Uroporphyrinogen decarboxylase (URO-D) [Limihaloglobus sulfuriphilus]|uniref:Uroporphyrinogen decarboxylase (URO-D) n=2 Tax=Limihaloglobus sulfuriphilus TaxID=1851148 RepID=A0A1Q2MBQ4_9BACT|nr:Uroporphyrinogen decarboxylase (URO-D) [Limihaloglobus sulfuriphilus]
MPSAGKEISMFYSIEQRVENFKKFYKRENDRPLLGFFVESEYPLHRYPASKSLPQGRPLAPDDFVVENYLADYDSLFDRHEAAGGDFIWAASSFWGIPWIEAAMGCKIIADHNTGSIHAETPADFDGEMPEFDIDNPWVQKGIEYLDKISSHCNGRYPLATPRLRGISDVLACLYGNESFVFKFFESPEKIDEQAAKITDFWISFAKTQLEHIPEFHGGIGSFYYNMWAPAGTVWLQEDAAALLSPDIFQRHILGCVKQIVASFNGSIVHMHPTGYYPYAEYLPTDMLALELHIDEGGPSAEELFEVHSKILAHKPLLVWGAIPEKDLDWIFSKLPAKGLAVLNALDRKQLESGENERLYEKYIQ